MKVWIATTNYEGAAGPVVGLTREEAILKFIHRNMVTTHFFVGLEEYADHQFATVLYNLDGEFNHYGMYIFLDEVEL